MITAIKREGKDAQLALLFDPMMSVEQVQTIRRDLVDFIGIAGQNSSISLEGYISSLMELVNVLSDREIDDYKETDELMKNALVVASPTRG